jgi:DNA-binding transcriptional LysR family regulator
MKINHLRNILAIAEQGSLRAAARQLDLAQPALSRSVQELEHELGTQLFERHARGMILTPVGLAFVVRAKNIMTEVRKAREEAEQLAGGTGGSVTIAMSIVAHLSIAPKILRTFLKRYPNSQLHIIEGLYTTVESRLKDGGIDFYVGPEPEQLPHELTSEKIFDVERTIFCRRGHPLAGAKSLKELNGADWMTTSITYNAEAELAELFGRHSLPLPRLVIRSQSALTFMISLSYSECLALLPVQWGSFPYTAGQLTSIDIADLPAAPPIVAIRRAGMPLTPAAEYLLDLVRRHKPPAPTVTNRADQRRRPSKPKLTRARATTVSRV